jgi:hypothetical protein
MSTPVIGVGGRESTISYSDYNEVLHNIMHSNFFDAVPVFNRASGCAIKVARRRMHAGDEDVVFLAGIEEVAWVSPEDEALSVAVKILGNEHHVALVGSPEKRPEGIITLFDLRTSEFRSHLAICHAEWVNESSEDMNEGVQLASFSVDLHDSLLSIIQAADLPHLMAEWVFVTEVNHILKWMKKIAEQSPLCRGYESDYDQNERRGDGLPDDLRNISAGDIAVWPMVGVTDPENKDDERNIHHTAARILGDGNAFDRVLMLSGNDKRVLPGVLHIFRLKPEEEIEYVFPLLNCDAGLEEVVANAHDNGAYIEGSEVVKGGGMFSIVFKEVKGGIEYGIITQDELSSLPVLAVLGQRLANLERKMKAFLTSQGIDEVRIYDGTCSTERATLGQLMKNEEIKRALRGYGETYKLHKFRNDLFHDRFAEDSKPIPIAHIKTNLDLLCGIEKGKPFDP